jgi:ABC-2 type transport system ATP-binding protein
MAMIQTTDLTKRYGDFLALDRLNLDHRGAATSSGSSGRTAPARRPRSGSWRRCCCRAGAAPAIHGIDVVKHPYEVKRIVGYMPDSFGVYDGMRLREYLDFFGAAYKIPKARSGRAIIDDVLELTDLTQQGGRLRERRFRGA